MQRPTQTALHALERHNLAAHPEFGAVLEKVAAELRPDLPSSHVPAFFRARGQQHDFLLDPANFSVVDAGEPTTGLGCVVCSVGTRRQYAFYVRCVDGGVQGPVGSSCIFEHVLGVERARGYGNSLRGLLRDLPHYRKHGTLLREENHDYDAYLQRLSLAYLSDARLRAKAQLTRTQQRELDRLRAAGHPLSPALYAALLQRGETLPPPQPNVPAEPDRPLDPELRSRARTHQEEVLSALPVFTRDHARRALEDGEVTVVAYLRRMIRDAVQRAEVREMREREAAMKRAAPTRAAPATVRTATRLILPRAQLLERWDELRPLLTSETVEHTWSVLYADGTLSPDECGEINAAVRRANQARLQRWNALALKVWPAPSMGRPDGGLLRAALVVFNQVKLVAAVEQQRPMTASELRQVGERYAYLLNPQPDPARRHAGTFFELLQAMVHHHRVPSAIQSLRKMTLRGSWLQALAPHYADYLLGQPLRPAEVMMVLRQHSARRGVDDVALPRAVTEQITARWSTLKGQLTWNAQVVAHPPIDRGRTVSIAIFEELLRALGQPVPAAQSATLPPPMSTPPRPAPPQVVSPPHQVQHSGSSQVHPSLPSAAIPQELRALVQARPALLEAVSPRLRPILETAVQYNTPITTGQLQLLNLTVKPFLDRASLAFVGALADLAADLGQRLLAREILNPRRIMFWRSGLAHDFEAFVRGAALDSAAVRRAGRLLEAESGAAAPSGSLSLVVTLPPDQRRAGDFLNGLAAALRSRDSTLLADRLLDPALEARWLALLPAAWRSFQADGRITESMVTAVRVRGSSVC